MTKIPVIIETSRHQIVGSVTLPAKVRLSDYACDPTRNFFALTDVVMAPLDHPERERSTSFILVARHEVALMRPAFGDKKVDEHRWSVGEVTEAAPIVANAGTPPTLPL